MKRKEPECQSASRDGGIVALEQRQCLVCGKLYETGNLLMDTSLRNIFKDKFACTGLGLCPEHQKYVDDGYVICVEVANKPAVGKTLKPEEADRTGNLCFIRKEAAQEIFNMRMDSPVAFLEIGVIDRLKGVFNDAMREEASARAV